jgi:protein-disulfide isomerase
VESGEKKSSDSPLKEMNNQKNNNSMLPVAIIGLVLIVALVGGWFWYSSTAKVNNSPSNTAKTSNNSAENFAKEVYPKGLPGANPPWMLGSPTATVTVEEFADFQCGSCAAKHPIAKQIISAYGSRIKFVFRNFPLQMHDKAYDAAVAAEAAGIQGKFWDMQNQLFDNQPTWGTSDPVKFRTVLEEYAQKIGLDVEKFKTDMAGLAAKNRVDQDMQRGRSLKVNSTPTFYINGKPLVLEQMTVEGMKQIIDAELQKAPQQ